ncbi:hypothetical protein MUK42_32978 [Musa troglodytarum]|uniref:Uncharacterized protein n=1 Tax=Musa troglodytarum TaxID=320322 RepID=A0A9E7I3G7_9LILI|nr:hypothetical protein MUK42_32978 [Musa troglodytarum]
MVVAAEQGKGKHPRDQRRSHSPMQSMDSLEKTPNARQPDPQKQEPFHAPSLATSRRRRCVGARGRPVSCRSTLLRLHRSRRRSRPEELGGQQHLVHRVHRQREFQVEVVVDGRLVDPRGHVHLVAAAGDVDGVDAAPPRCLRVHRVARGLEGGWAVVPREDVVEDQRHLLLGRQAVERAGFQVAEGIVGGGEDGEAIEGVVQLALDLLPYLRLSQQAKERAVLPALLENAGEVERRRRRTGSHLGLGLAEEVGRGEEEECGQTNENG